MGKRKSQQVEEDFEEQQLVERARIVLETVESGEMLSTPRDLYRFMFSLTGEQVPFQPCCKNHQTPWDMIWESYKVDLPQFKNDPLQDLVAIGPREGFKTMSTAKLNALELLTKPKVQIASVGAVQRQATKCYKWTSKYLYHPIVAELGLVLRNIMQETVLSSGSMYEQLVGNLTGVNSPHPNKLRADEVELMKEAVVEEMKMVASSYGNWKSHMLYTSTRKFVDGIMSQLAEMAKKKGARAPKLILWCYKDVSEPCPDERSGVNKQIYEVEDIFNHGEKVVVEAYEYCGDCSLLPSCRGDLKRAKGFIPIDDTIKKWNDLDREKWLAQKECVEPPRSSLFFYDWNDKLQSGPYEFNSRFPVDLFIDFTGGGEDPSIFQFWQTWDDGNDYLVLEAKFVRKSTPIVAREVENLCRDRHMHPQVMMGDSSQMQQIRDLRSASPFFRNLRPVRKIDRKEGLSICRRRIRDNNGARHTFVNERCLNFRNEIARLKQRPSDPDDHKDGNDHSIDAWRYRNVYRYYTIGEPRFRTLSNDDDDSVDNILEPTVLPKQPKESRGVYDRIDRYLAESD